MTICDAIRRLLRGVSLTRPFNSTQPLSPPSTPSTTGPAEPKQTAPAPHGTPFDESALRYLDIRLETRGLDVGHVLGERVGITTLEQDERKAVELMGVALRGVVEGEMAPSPPSLLCQLSPPPPFVVPPARDHDDVIADDNDNSTSASPSRTPSSGSNSSRNLSSSSPPSSVNASPTLTRSSTLTTLGSGFHRRSFSSSRSQMSSSAPSSYAGPASSPPLTLKINTRLDQDGRRVLTNRRRQSVEPQPKKVHRVKKVFGVGDGDESSCGEDVDEELGAGLAGTSLPIGLEAVDSTEADDEFEEVILDSKIARASSPPQLPCRRNSAPAYPHRQPRRYLPPSPRPQFSPVPISTHFTPTPPSLPSSPSFQPRNVFIIPRPSRHLSLTSIHRFLPSSPIDRPLIPAETSPEPPANHQSLRRRSVISFDLPPSPPQRDHHSRIHLPRRASMTPRYGNHRDSLISVPLPTTTKIQRRETMSAGTRYGSMRDEFGETDGVQRQREGMKEWWEMADERDRQRGLLKVVNPDDISYPNPSLASAASTGFAF